jgi:hypothetical protein
MNGYVLGGVYYDSSAGLVINPDCAAKAHPMTVIRPFTI